MFLAQRTKLGFTLVELVTVTACIAIVLAVTPPATRSADATAQKGMVVAARLQSIERIIEREPEYESGSPKYCLMAFGPDAHRCAWFVLDGDNIYIDRNCNRDLTDDGAPMRISLVNENMNWKLLKEGRHFVDLRDPSVKTTESRDVALLKETDRYTRFGVDLFIRDPDYRPKTPIEAEQFELFLRRREGFVNINLRVDGKFQQLGMARLARTPEEAPVMLFDGPLSLMLSDQDLTLKTGTDVPLVFQLVTPGSDQETVTVHNARMVSEECGLMVDVEFPIPAKSSGRRPLTMELSTRSNFFGYLAVPEDIPPGVARLDVEPHGLDDFAVAPATFYIPVMDSAIIDDSSSNEAYDGQGVALLGKKAPDFETKLFDGEDRSLNDYRGKVVVVSFWATWCPPCLAELVILSDLHEEYQDRDLEILAISCDEDQAVAEKCLQEREVHLAAALDSSKALREKFDVTTLPQLVVIDKEGTVVELHDKLTPDLRKKLHATVEKLLAAP